MNYNPEKHHRRSIRLRDYDYSQSGAYFVTICAAHKACLFGDVIDGEMILNEYGEIVAEEWLRTAQIRPYVELDGFVVMPNHFHGIIFIMDQPGNTRAWREFAKPIARSLPTIVGAFKSAVTKRVNCLRDTPGGVLWQRNYFETVLRNDRMLNARRQYIALNPARWMMDEHYPGTEHTGTF